jgi:ubiquitin-like protein ATG12
MESEPSTPNRSEAARTENAGAMSSIPDSASPPDLPLTMAASVLLTALPRDAHAALREASDRDATKVQVVFQPIAGAPSLRKSTATISAGQKFERVVIYLRKQLGCKPEEGVNLYVKSVFAPAPDENVGNLFRVRIPCHMR